MQEPLSYLYDKYGVHRELVSEIVCGEKYVAIVLKDGNIGICATLGYVVQLSISDLATINLSEPTNRIVATAYFNALFNYQQSYTKEIDIFDAIDFSIYNSICMIGYFGSLSEKFHKKGIKLSIFDHENKSLKIEDPKSKQTQLAAADALIITATTVFNNSFDELVEACSLDSHVYILGPSTIIHSCLFIHPQIKGLFGSIFTKNDRDLLQIIKEGGGTKSFLHLMKKIHYYQTN